MLGFAPGVADRIGYYVYLLIDPRSNDIFYVGKGVRNRCFSHLVAARKTTTDSDGDYPKLARIREIEAAGATVQIDVLRYDLTEPEALLVEAAAIDLLALERLLNRVAGHDDISGRMSIAYLNGLYGARQVPIAPEHRVLLININRNFDREITDEALYDATRKWWVLGERWCQIDSPDAPEWVFAVYRGVVRAVYRIAEWERPTDQDRADSPKLARRVGFRGTRSHEMEAMYLYADVSGYATQNPVRYVNCGPASAALSTEKPTAAMDD